jgi:feruloyl esterase
MKTTWTSGVIALLLAVQTPGGPSVEVGAQAALPVCDASTFADLKVENAIVHAAEVVEAGRFTPPRASAPMANVPAFCRIHASATPTAASLVHFEVWVPRTWNGKLVVTGNGGYGNVPSYGDMARALAQGYAAVGGDTGHQTPTPDDLEWGMGHPERIIDWGSRSIHAITVPSKRIIERASGTAPRRAYYTGCSTGGHQGYAEMQRYPDDFDGVIAGAPGNNRVRLNAGFLWQFLANRTRGDNQTLIIPAAKLPLVTRAVVAACDANDGVSDGVVDDPRSCAFDPASLQCAAGDEATCLTPLQVETLNKMYDGARNPRTGEQVYPGWPKSSEALTTTATGAPASGWHQYWGREEPARAAFWRLWAFENPAWDWWSFDFDRDLDRALAKLGPMVDQVNPDLDAFRRRGGKAIVYQGWQDPVVNALDTIAYYDRVRSRHANQDGVDSFVRLFMVPGMGHCSGGTGATNFGNQNASPLAIDPEHDLLSALDAWVEQGRAPDRIIASRVAGGQVVRTRPLCPYPRRAVYTGSGNTDDAANFVCK